MDNIESPIVSAIMALVTLITTYYAKLKKNFDKIEKLDKAVNGDEDRESLSKRIKRLEEYDHQSLDSEIIVKQQEAIEKALKPIWSVLDKKADKELLEVQVQHILEAIDRIGRGNSG